MGGSRLLYDRYLLSWVGNTAGHQAPAAPHSLASRSPHEPSCAISHALPLPPFAPVHIIGLDDWAWKRRERYGAIIVDLERGTPIALLADRSQEAVRPWLEQHPIIDLVARDRSKEFAAAIDAALPHATQVADRWHLACNLTEQLDKVVSGRWKLLTKAARPADALLPDLVTAPPPRPRRGTAGEARYEQIQTLAQAGVPVKSIAARLGVSHGTIYRWLAKGHGPHGGPRKQRAGPLDWITPYVRERWEAGEDNGPHLWEELKTLGYTGSLRSMYRRLAVFRGGTRPYRSPSSASAEAVPRSPLDEVTPGKVIGWIIARPETLTPEGRNHLEWVCQMDPVIAQARDLTQRWLDFTRAHTSERLDTWLREVRASAIPAFVSFARGIERDKAAVVAGLALPYSTGPVEGHITRLKLIKRQAYGRASLAYLRQRFLAA